VSRDCCCSLLVLMYYLYTKVLFLIKIHAIDDFCCIQPLCIRIFPEPGELSFGIATGVLFYLTDRLFQFYLPVKIIKEFGIPNRLKGLACAIGDERGNFVKKASLHHP